MFDDIDEAYSAEHNPEQLAYQEGIQQARNDPETKQKLSELSRENFSRGHNAGFACGIMIAILDSSPSAAFPFSKNSSASPAANALLLDLQRFVKKTSSLKTVDDENQKEQEEFYKNVSADETEEKEGDSNQKEEEENSYSFKDDLVAYVSRFLKLIKEENVPPEAWKFLVQLVQDNNAVRRGGDNVVEMMAKEELKKHGSVNTNWLDW